MRKYFIEREIPGVGKMDSAGLTGAAGKSNDVLSKLGPGIQWLESYVTDDKIVCVYLAEDEGLIRKHAAESGFPATHIREVRAIIDPSTAQG